MESFLQDLRHAARGLLRDRVFALTAVAVLALGVGANTAIFTVLDAALLRDLPYASPDRLVHIWETSPRSLSDRSEASYPDYLDFLARQRSFTAVGGFHGGSFTLGAPGGPEQLAAGRVTANFFDVLGVRPAMGRAFRDGEDAVGAAPVLLLTHGAWQARFGGDPAIVGKSVPINGRPREIVGVLPAEFTFGLLSAPEIFVPIDMAQATRANRGVHWLRPVARLGPGVTLAQARADMSGIMRQLAAEHPMSKAGRGAAVVPLHEEVVGAVRPILLALGGAVAVVLLAACANVAGLLTARAHARRRELAVRAALGAGRGRLARLVMAESALLALAGGLAGALLARAVLPLLLAGIPESELARMPYLRDLGIDWRVLAYALGVSLATGALFGIAPALRASGARLSDALRAGGSRGATARGGVRAALVVAEFALTLVLLAGAGLMARSLAGLLAIDPGFRSEGVLTLAVNAPSAKFPTPASRQALVRAVVARLEALPGVQAAGATTRLPLDPGNTLSFAVEGRPAPAPGSRPGASYRAVAGDYFEALSIPLVAGRPFAATDADSAPPVVIVDRTLAEQVFPGEDPVGRRLQIRAAGSPPHEIVGVVGAVKAGRLDDAPTPVVYLPHAQSGDGAVVVALRTARDPMRLAAAAREAVRAVDPDVAVHRVRSMEEVVATSPALFNRRYPLQLIGAFALATLLLAAVGLYGVVSYAVAQRTRELGIRMALGARPGDITGLVVREGGGLALAGVGVGIVAALGAARVLSSLLYGVTASDAPAYAGAGLVLAAVGLLASWVPARRASRLDPAVSLRAE